MAKTNPLQPFFWGAGGTAMTAEQVARERELAALLSEQGADFSPVAHWLEGAARMAHAGAGAFRNWRADEGERSGKDAWNTRWGEAFGGGGSSPVAEALAGTSGGSGSGSALSAANSVGQAAPTTSSFSGTQQEFIDMLMPTAMEVGAELGIDPRIIVAQAAQETGWGRSAPGNNFFGIKSHGQSGGQTLNTHEYINGERVNVSDSFRTFGSPEDSVRGYGNFIRSNPRYGDFMAAQGLDAQLDALQASGYATDPNYSTSVGSIARGISLPQQPTQVASIDPTMNAVMTPEMHAAFDGVDPNELIANLPNTAMAPADPSVMTRTLPFRPGGPSQANLPPNAAPGTVAQGPDGQTYMYAETSGMAGATGDYGWIPYNGGGTPEQPVQVAQAGGGMTPDIAQLLALAGDPNAGYASPTQQQIIQALIGQNMQNADPMRQLQMQKLQMELDAMANPQQPPQPRRLTPEEMEQWGLPADSGSWGVVEGEFPQQLFTPPTSPDSAAEAKIGRLMELGYDRDQAIRIADQYVLGQDENGRSTLFDRATGHPAHPILLQGQTLPGMSSSGDLAPLPGSSEFAPVGTEAPNYSTLPPGTDINATLGAGGVVQGAANSIVDFLTGNAPFEDQTQAANALQNLRLQTNQALLEGFAGRQNVYTQEMIDELAVLPGMPPSAARDRFRQTKTLIDQQIARIENEVLANPRSWTPDEVREAQASVASLRALVDTYNDILGSIDSREQQSDQDRPPLETFMR